MTLSTQGFYSARRFGKSAGRQRAMNPGHYLATIRNPTTGVIVSWSTILSTELPATPTLRGVEVRYNWADLEPTKGAYDFSEITANLASLAAVSGGARRLCILLDLKSFDTAKDVVPAWMMTDEYGGGQFEFAAEFGAPGGNIVRLDNANVRARLAMLADALSQAFADEEYLEMISFPETSVPTPIDPTVSYPDHYAGLLSVASVFLAAFPRKIIRMMVNYVAPLTADNNAAFVTSMAAANIPSIGWANTKQDEANYRKVTPYTGVYTLAEARMGDMVIAAEVQGSDYAYTNTAGTGGSIPTVQQLLDYLKTTFEVNYIFWTRSTAVNVGGLKDYENVYALLNEATQTADIYGGLNPTTPSRM